MNANALRNIREHYLLCRQRFTQWVLLTWSLKWDATQNENIVVIYRYNEVLDLWILDMSISSFWSRKEIKSSLEIKQAKQSKTEAPSLTPRSQIFMYHRFKTLTNVSCQTNSCARAVAFNIVIGNLTLTVTCCKENKKKNWIKLIIWPLQYLVRRYFNGKVFLHMSNS